MAPFEHAPTTSDSYNAIDPVAQSSLIGAETSNGVGVTDQLQSSAGMVDADHEGEGCEVYEEESDGDDDTVEDEDDYETAEDEDEDDSEEDEDDSDEEDEDEDTDSGSDGSSEGNLRKKSTNPVFTWESLDAPPLPLPWQTTIPPPKTANLGMLSNLYSASPSSHRTVHANKIHTSGGSLPQRPCVI